MRSRARYLEPDPGRRREGAGGRCEKAQPDAAGRTDLRRTGPSRIRLRAVLRRVRAERHTAAGDRQAGRSPQQGPRRTTGAKTLRRSRRRYHRAWSPRAKTACGPGPTRNRAADADPESGGGEMSAAGSRGIAVNLNSNLRPVKTYQQMREF